MTVNYLDNQNATIFTPFGSWSTDDINDENVYEKPATFFVNDQFYLVLGPRIVNGEKVDRWVKFLYHDEELERDIWLKCFKAVKGTWQEAMRYEFYNVEKEQKEIGTWDYIADLYDIKTRLKPILEFVNITEQEFNKARRLTYKEAFGIKNDNLRMKVFENINIEEMIENLGSEKISTEGLKVKRRTYMPNSDGEWDINSYKLEDKHVWYELHKVETSALLDNPQQKIFRYVVKCQCSSTHQYHWLWVEDEYATDPLTAIASTCRIQEDLIDDIEFLQRQGDLFIANYKDDFDCTKIDPNKPKRALTKDEYFKLLVAES